MARLYPARLADSDMKSFDLATAHCIVSGCRRPIVCTSGHVHQSIWHLFAGRCREHAGVQPTSPPLPEAVECETKGQGCYGEWKSYMGINLGITGSEFKNGTLDVSF